MECIEYVELLSASYEAAHAAIASQVLQTGAASRTKDGTKTGAADALVLAAVTELLDRYDEVVLATGDKRLATEARALRENVTIVTDQRQLWEWHGVAPQRMK